MKKKVLKITVFVALIATILTAVIFQNAQMVAVCPFCGQAH